jgi:hypothetical protein
VTSSKDIINMVKQLGSWEYELIFFSKSFAQYATALSDFNLRFSHIVKKIETATMSVDSLYPSSKPLIALL